jgi:hypothetical protein
VYGQRGKPALALRFADSGWRFNVSHSSEVAVYAFSRGREIGVDVEAVRALRDPDDIAACFFPAAKTRLTGRSIRATSREDSLIGRKASGILRTRAVSVRTRHSIRM